MLPNVADPVIQGETNPSRFEKFCVRLLERSEGTTLLPTSVTHDRGRDAVSIAPSRGSHATVLCVTLNRDIDEKVRGDLRRVSDTSTPDRLIYCSSQKLTESRVDELTAEIRARMPTGCSIVVLGAQQLAHLTERFPDALQEFYHAEIRTIEEAFFSFQRGEEKTENRGLRLALVAFSSDDASALRSAVSQRAILDVLRDIGSGDFGDIAQTLSSDLGLPKTINLHYVERIVTGMETDALTCQDSGKWALTEAGRREAETVPPEAARELLTGRTIIREALKEMTGISLADGQFEDIWSGLLDFLSELFYTKGLSIIQAVNQLLTSGAEPTGTKLSSNLEVLVAEGAKKAKATISSPELAQEIEQAVLDMFSEPSGPVFDWLARVCERFVALCALGLESTSAEEIHLLLRRHRVVLDSDIVLTLLCEAEANHLATKDFIIRWRELGGGILLARPVLEEVAHHAWISENDFVGTKQLAGRLMPAEAHHYAQNAFVRAFLFLEKDASGWEKKWRIYIGQFRGTNPNDYSNLLDLLQGELGAEILPSAYDPALQRQISEFQCKLLAQYVKVAVGMLDPRDVDKARRDGDLLASIAATRDIQRRLGSDITITLLSSSPRLREADARFRESLGTPDAVLSLGAFLYLLSLLPGVRLGAGSLRRALFEFGHTAHLQDADRLALRVIKATGQYDLPWARRRTLHQHLKLAIHREAKRQDVKVETIREKFNAANQSVHPADIILDTLKSMAVSDAKTVELREAQRTISVLKERERELKQQLTAALAARKTKKRR
jgi:hypothetical protein